VRSTVRLQRLADPKLWWVLGAAVLALTLAAVARDFGDSPEYLAYAKAWISHGSPFLQPEDYTWARQWHPQR